MIEFSNEIDFKLQNEDTIANWISQVIQNEGFKLGELHYIFCSDEQLLDKNIKFLQHDTYTDIISFDYTMGSLISGDIFISIDRVRENAEVYKVSFENELQRVMVHGVLHFCKYKDKTGDEKLVMREMEDLYLSKLE